MCVCMCMFLCTCVFVPHMNTDACFYGNLVCPQLETGPISVSSHLVLNISTVLTVSWLTVFLTNFLTDLGAENPPG